MKHKSFGRVGLVVAMLSVLATACTPNELPPPAPFPTAWMDPVGTLMIPASAQNQLTYRQGESFHRDLHASMKGQTSPINVAIDAGTTVRLQDFSQTRNQILQTDNGLLRWTTRVKETGGAVMACSTTPPESGLWAVLAILADIAAGWVNEYLTYRPAENYHAVLFYDRGTDRVERVKFIARSGVDINTLSCASAASL